MLIYLYFIDFIENLIDISNWNLRTGTLGFTAGKSRIGPVCGSGMYIMTLDFTEVNSHRARERGERNEKSLVCTVPYAKSKQDERTSPFLME